MCHSLLWSLKLLRKNQHDECIEGNAVIIQRRQGSDQNTQIFNLEKNTTKNTDKLAGPMNCDKTQFTISTNYLGVTYRSIAFEINCL